MTRRWPLHPPPYPNEALSSWILRIATTYNMSPSTLITNEFDISIKNSYLNNYLDLNPPIELLKGLSKCTGFEYSTIKSLTAQSYVPLLIDNLDFTDENLFHHYINQFSFCSGKKDTFKIPWIPWWNNNPSKFSQGCVLCLKKDQEPYQRLYWRFLWMNTCPKHNLFLSPIRFHREYNKKTTFHYTNSRLPTIVPDALHYLDSLTLQAITTCNVTLPHRIIHGGVWLRILRRIIEELNTPSCHKQIYNFIKLSWNEISFFIHTSNCIFEKQSPGTRLKVMQLASLMLQTILSEKLSFSSTIADILCPIKNYEKNSSLNHAESST